MRRLLFVAAAVDVRNRLADSLPDGNCRDYRCLRIAGGLGIGVAMVFLSSANVRVSAESQLLPFGIGGTLFMLAWSVVSTDRASAQVEIGIGALVFASLVAGIVLSVSRRIKPGA